MEHSQLLEPAELWKFAMTRVIRFGKPLTIAGRATLLARKDSPLVEMTLFIAILLWIQTHMYSFQSYAPLWSFSRLVTALTAKAWP